MSGGPLTVDNGTPNGIIHDLEYKVYNKWCIPDRVPKELAHHICELATLQTYRRVV